MTSRTSDELCDPSVAQHYKGHKDAITGLDFNPNGRQLASASLDGTIMVWNFRSPQARVFRFSGHTDGVTSVKFSPSGHLVASSSRDRSVRLWVPSIKGENTAFKSHSGHIFRQNAQPRLIHNPKPSTILKILEDALGLS